jgi:hypothetical protein
MVAALLSKNSSIDLPDNAKALKTNILVFGKTNTIMAGTYFDFF